MLEQAYTRADSAAGFAPKDHWLGAGRVVGLVGDFCWCKPPNLVAVGFLVCGCAAVGF